MRILYLGLKYDYGQPERGYSFEHYTFFDTLRRVADHLIYFDFASLLRAGGKEWMNRRLLEVVQAEQPDLLFSVLFQDEVEPATLRAISRRTDTVTLNWFCDDHWRFDNFSRRWAPCFNWVITTDRRAVPKYARLGCTQVIHSQWACNHYLYRHLTLPPAHQVTFVGQPHGNRVQVIDMLRAGGIAVETWGRGWENGRVDYEEMIHLFNASRINLNLPNASLCTRSLTARAAGMLRRRLLGMPSTVATHAVCDQIKGRNFEVPGCGGFLLTGRVEGLEQYYDIGLEIVCYDNIADLQDKIAYYLRHENERAAIARAGYARTLREHTYMQRFAEIFRRIGLPFTAPDPDGTRAGVVEEVGG